MRAAVINLRCGGDIAANLETAAHYIRAAHADGAKLIATPENTLLMQPGSKKLFAAIQPETDTQGVKFFSALSKELEVDLLIGSMAIKLSERQAANRSFLFGPDGEIKARYDKIHMFDVTINETETWQESANYQAGDTPVIAETGGFNLGMSICYDLRFANLYKYYARAGAHIMSIPSAFTTVTGKAHWKALLRARAIETSAYVLAPAQGGLHEGGRATWGRSMIVDPWGEVIAVLDHDDPGFVCADISITKLLDIRGRIPAWGQETPLVDP